MIVVKGSSSRRYRLANGTGRQHCHSKLPSSKSAESNKAVRTEPILSNAHYCLSFGAAMTMVGDQSGSQIWSQTDTCVSLA